MFHNLLLKQTLTSLLKIDGGNNPSVQTVETVKEDTATINVTSLANLTVLTTPTFIPVEVKRE
jgi:hypothetical protein